MIALSSTDENFIAEVNKWCDATWHTNDPHSLMLKPVGEVGTCASINFVIPLSIPKYFYDKSVEPDPGYVVMSRDEFIKRLPSAFHEYVSTEGLDGAFDVISKAMFGKERYILSEKIGGMFISSATLLAVIVDENEK